MAQFTEFIKKWGAFVAALAFVALMVVLFIISECKTDSAFLRIITGISTLCPAGAVLPWITKTGLDNTQE